MAEYLKPGKPQTERAEDDAEMEGFVGHAEQANLRVGRDGGKNVAYGAAAE